MSEYVIGSKTYGKGYHPELNMVKQQNEIKNYTAFIENAKVYFLAEALNYVLGDCLGQENNRPGFGRNICIDFVREEGYENLMRRFRTTTHNLALMEQAVSEVVESVKQKCDKEDKLTWTINNADQEKFFDKMKDLPVKDLTKAVNQRVCDAAEEFVQKNINMKLDIEEIATKTKERIDAAKAKYGETMANKIQQEQMTAYKRAVNTIKATPTRNVYDHMMRVVSEVALANDESRDAFMNESGKFDMSKVEDTVRTMYTFLEMVNSLKIKKVDNKYIEECLASIK